MTSGPTAADHPGSHSGAGIQVDLGEAIYALSDALDLAGLDDVGHGKRVAAMALACAGAAGADQAESAFVFELGLLHDIGVSSTQVHKALVTHMEWSDAQVHCELGAQRLASFAPLASLAEPVRWHHTHWSQLADQADDAARWANLIFLVDRVDALRAGSGLAGGPTDPESIRREIAARRGGMFSPQWVEVFDQVSRADAFWLQLEFRGLKMLQLQMARSRPRSLGSMEEMRQLAVLFASIVDAKSPFTAEHSRGVARLARYLAGRLGVSEENCAKIEIAGLLHDIGKLRVPDEILDKPGPLDARERGVMNAHSYETYLILRGIEGIEDIADWAASHHEEPRAAGYPFRLKAETLPLEARILRIADIYQALVQDRPYRGGLRAAQALGHLRKLVAAGRAETLLVETLADNLEEAHRWARPSAAQPVACPG